MPHFVALVRGLNPTDPPPVTTVEALFRAFDSDASGTVDQAEIVAGCQILCGGDQTAKLRLAGSPQGYHTCPPHFLNIGST